MKGTLHRFQRRTVRAISIVEMVVLIVVTGIAVPPVLGLFQQTLLNTSQATMETRALELAKSLTEEILSEQFEDPQSATGSFGTEETGRINYDDVDDYNGYDQTPPTDCRGTALTAYTPFRTRVTVENVSGDAPGGAAVANGSSDYKRITVTVSWYNNTRNVKVVSLMAAQNEDMNRSPVILTYLSRRSSSSDDMTFRVRNDSDRGIYLTNIIATWSSPTAWYESISVNAIGYMNYGTVWSYSQTNNVRMESSGNAMFNQGDLIYVPAGTTMEITLWNFRNSRTYSWPASCNVTYTPFTIQIWASPDHVPSFTVPSF